MEIALIVAIGPNNVIGIGDKLPWHSKQDFYHFKTTTKGYPCIFGDKTYFTLPKYPLKNRLNIVTSLDYKEDEVIVCSEFNCNVDPVEHKDTGSFIKAPSIENAIKLASNFEKVFICGGKSIYKYVIENNIINTIYLTRIISPELQKNVEENKDLYVYFPYDMTELLRNGWKKEKFTYKKNELPEEFDNLTVLFSKYSKID